MVVSGRMECMDTGLDRTLCALRECFGAPWTWKMKKMTGFTDLRNLGGNRRRGGGIDTDHLIKLGPPLLATPGRSGFSALGWVGASRRGAQYPVSAEGWR